MPKYSCFIFSLILSSADFCGAWTFNTAAQDNSPKYFVVATPYKNEVRGYCVDILRAMEIMDSKLKFEGDQRLLPFSRLLNDLAQGRLDVFCGLQKNVEREAKFIFFNEPILYLQGKMVVLSEEVLAPRSWKDMQAIKGANNVVLTIKGTASAAYLKDEVGLRVDDSPLTVDQALKMLLNKRGRFLFYHDLAVVDAITRMDLRSKIRVLPADFYSEGQYFAVSRSLDEKKVERLRSTYKKLVSSGKLRQILSKYPTIRRENLAPIDHKAFEKSTN